MGTLSSVPDVFTELSGFLLAQKKDPKVLYLYLVGVTYFRFLSNSVKFLPVARAVLNPVAREKHSASPV